MTDPHVTQIHVCRVGDVGTDHQWEASIMWSDATVSTAKAHRHDDAIDDAWLAERLPIKGER